MRKISGYLAGFVFLCAFAQPTVAQEIGLPTLAPAALNVNAPTRLFVSAILQVPNVIPGSVNIQRVENDGRVTVVGLLNDSGTDGDSLASDGVYSGHLDIQEPSVGRVGIRVSAAAKGLLKRIISPTFNLEVLPVGAPTAAVTPHLNNFSFDPGTGEKIVADQVIVCFKEGVSYSGVTAAAGSVGGTIAGRFSEIGNCYQIQLPAGSDGTKVSNAISVLKTNLNVDSASPDYFGKILESCFIPTCIGSGSSYSKQLSLPLVHDNFGKGKGVRIGIVDTGVSLDLATTFGLGEIPPWIIGPDFSIPGPWFPGAAQDDVGHGTLVASVVKATSPDSELYINKIHNAVSGGSTSTLVNGLADMAANNVQVVNISYKVPPTAHLDLAIKTLLKKKIVVVAAAGNDGNNVPIYPGAYPNVLTVGAVNDQDVIALISSFGSHVEVAAPGVNIFGYGIGGISSAGNGTSFAAPFVTGLVALIKSKFPGIDPVPQVLSSTLQIPATIGADTCPNQPCNQDLGSGRIAPLAALGALRITRNTAIGAGATQSTRVTISPTPVPAYQTVIQTSGQSQGCQNINNKSTPCLVDIPFDFAKLSPGNHRITLTTLESGSVSFFGTLQLNSPDVTFVSVDNGNGSIINSKRASVSLFSFSTKSTTFVVNRK